MGAERGAAGLGGESADLRLQPQTFLGSAESNLQVHTSLALKSRLSLCRLQIFFLLQNTDVFCRVAYMSRADEKCEFPGPAGRRTVTVIKNPRPQYGGQRTSPPYCRL